MVFTTPFVNDAYENGEKPIAGYIPEALAVLQKDLRSGARTLTDQEVRYIVWTYYNIQDYRIKSSNQIRALERAENPIALLEWIFSSISGMEKEIQKWMLAYARSKPSGQWALSVLGIGPVIAAGFLSNLNMEKTTNISKFWAFAGLDPTKTWEKGQKRPWNADLKVLAYKAGESFVKVSNRPNDVYGQLYKARKARDQARNEAGEYVELCKAILAKKKFGADTDALAHYSSGRLPPAHIHARARRYAVKVFMGHLWQIKYEETYQRLAPDPWILTPMGGHSDRIFIPNHECPYGPNH